ncbi:MSMEG_6728 family protein [Herbiconiux sp. CPCC 205716]|uniref:MSMEG_6728 family protein n=1 Tax=Herbiconiux gentiana TaxID=2970912 RepID=A0ABT2GBM4_9MICO|nr:MSMEG_6728 family protein [Herbiconiux gentiana]MCS5713598.1 MSMEG_6728 family protein [Herbiconiux gentiana]
MQTFLPYPDFRASARALDRARLGKQRVEALQVLRAVTILTYGWRNHPAATMWRGYLPALTKYALEVTDEWIAQGHADTVRPQVLAFAPEVDALPQSALALPPWIGDEAFHLSHRSNLLRKDPEFYGELFPGVPIDLPYVWPAQTAGTAEAAPGGGGGL